MARRLVLPLFALGAALCLLVPSVAGAQEQLASFHLPPSGRADSNVKLKGGQVYKMTISGTRKNENIIRQGDFDLTDAFWCFQSDASRGCPPAVPAPVSRNSIFVGTREAVQTAHKPLQAFVVGEQPVPGFPANRAPTYAASHEYTFQFRPEASGTLVMSTNVNCGASPQKCSGAGFDVKVFGEAAGDRVTLSSVNRKVEVSRNESGWESAANGMELGNGDRVHTGFKAGVTVNFPDGSRLFVNDMTLLEITEVGKGPEGGIRARLLLKTGEVKAQVNRSTGARGDFNVKTPTSTASVRGTKFSVAYDGTATTVAVTESSVTVTANGGASIIVPAGMETRSTASSVTPVAPIGKGFKSGGLSSRDALARVSSKLTAGLKRCKLSVVSNRLAPVTGGWSAQLVIIRAGQGIESKPRGTARFQIKGTRVSSGNSLAKRIAGGCR
jgi:hypothetical protein